MNEASYSLPSALRMPPRGRRLRIYASAALLLALASSCDNSAADPACSPDSSLEPSDAAASELGTDHHRVDSFIIIDAPAEMVWDVLTDFDTMPDWSSSFQGLSGEVRDGGEVVATYLVQDPMTGEVGPLGFPHTLRYEDGESFGWSDPVAFAPGITDDHVFRIGAISDCQTRLVQTDEFQGNGPRLSPQSSSLSSRRWATQSFNTELEAELEARWH